MACRNAASSGDSSPKLHSSVAASVRCRSGPARRPVSTEKRSLSWDSSPATPKTSTRVAASSIARAMPSRRRQMSATTGASASDRLYESTRSRARSTNSWIAGYRRASPASTVAPSGGELRPSSRRTRSRFTISGSRLVARMRTPGARARMRSAQPATASMTCSQLSSSRSVRRPCRKSQVDPSMSAEVTPTPMAAAMAFGTSSGSVRVARSISHTPSGNSSSDRSATARATVVLPMPPGPTIETSRPVSSSAESDSITSVRPKMRVVPIGRLWPGRGAAGECGADSPSDSTGATNR